MRTVMTGTVVALACASLVFAAARQRPPLPKITKPVMFDTPEADAILSALQVFPISAGKGGDWKYYTTNGIHLAMSREPVTVMLSEQRRRILVTAA